MFYNNAIFIKAVKLIPSIKSHVSVFEINFNSVADNKKVKYVYSRIACDHKML